MSLKETKARLLEASKTADGFLSLISDLEIRTEEKILKEALSELHNSGEIDLVEAVIGVNRDSNGNDFFTILHIFESMLPSLDASVEDVVRCLVHLSQQADGDLAIGGVYGAFEGFCRMEVHRPRHSIEFILAQSDPSVYAPLLSSSILAYDSERVTEAIQMIESLISNRNETVRSKAYFTLGRINIPEDQANVIWRLLSSRAYSEEENECCASILRAILYFGEKFPSYWSQIEELLHTFVDGTIPEVLYAISDIVAFQRIVLPENVLHFLIMQFAYISPDHKGIIDNIDHLLVQLINKYLSPFAVELLESILVVGVEFKMLDYFSNELLSKHRELLNHIVTKWFLSGDSLLCHGVLDLLHNATGEEIELKAEMALLDNDVTQIFVSHKAVGWLFTQPIAAASFILSVYETASTNTRKELEKVLYEPLLLSYSGELKRFLQSCIDNDLQTHLCERLLGKLLDYHADIEKVSGLKELMAPRENVNAYWKESNKNMQAAYEQASRGSFIDLIATKKTLLYGNSSIYYVHLGDGEQVRQEMQMQSFSLSTEMPRLNILDPESLDYILRVYRCEGMKNEVNS
ncbi:hypothetical protein [Vibrio diazotrophicus]|uniref:hypothetical protein n=1 Tax=Vibrio diazotrophicus TaxID=685 RepID=UPI000C9DD23A|nr:hypothetical protein [Vibrio diazotrophicus]PNH92565.1 hypothetical protein C1O24_20235 [Vibrio diazotrophicus]